MNILVVSQYFWPENFRINDLVKAWVQRGHHVTVLTGIPNYPSGTVFESYKKHPGAFTNYEGARVVRVPMLRRAHGGFRLILNYLSFVIGGCVFGPIRLREFKPDVIFVCQLSPVTIGLPAILLGRVKVAPVVLWVLDLWPETLAAIGVVRSPRVLRWIGYLVRFIYNRCTLVLGQSQGFMQNLTEYCSDKRKIRYFPSWAEDIFRVNDVDSVSEIPNKDNVFNVMFAGNVGEAQDMPAVLAAAEILRWNSGIRWLIVGDGRKSDWMRREINSRGLENTVLMLGRYPIERMPSFYARADALLVSLKRDPVFSLTIPGKVQSYLMAGVPILGMLDGEGAGVIQRARAGLVCPAGDFAGLAQCILRMKDEPHEVLRQWGQNGRQYALEEFGRERLLERMDTLLNEAIRNFAGSNR